MGCQPAPGPLRSLFGGPGSERLSTPSGPHGVWVLDGGCHALFLCYTDKDTEAQSRGAIAKAPQVAGPQSLSLGHCMELLLQVFLRVGPETPSSP